MTNNFVFEPNMDAKQIHIVREFNAPVEKVWKAHTDPDILIKWMAPKPMTPIIKMWDFRVGGMYLYTLIDGDNPPKHWTRMEFTEIEDGSAYSATGMFSDELGSVIPEGPRSYRVIKFIPLEGNRTAVDTMITFDDEAIFKWFTESGFKQGSIMTFENLDELLAAE